MKHFEKEQTDNAGKQSTEEMIRTLQAELKSLKSRVSALSAFNLSSVNPTTPISQTIGSPAIFCEDPVRHDHYKRFKHVPDYRRYAKDDPYPIPALEDREYYFPDQHYDYWISGLTDYLRIKERLETEGFEWHASKSVFDFGCSSGRVLRHFAHLSPHFQITGADVNANHVTWINRHLPPAVTCFQCINLPSLPIADATYDLIYAFSVFTHIDELEDAWLLELNRVLKPGGYVWLSIQSQATWKQIASKEHFMFQHLKNNEPNMDGITIDEDLFLEAMPTEKYVFRFNNGVVYNTCVFHEESYINRQWGRIFDVIDIIRCGHDWQDVVLLRKKK